jgi:hypothetical protein
LFFNDIVKSKEISEDADARLDTRIRPCLGTGSSVRRMGIGKNIPVKERGSSGLIEGWRSCGACLSKTEVLKRSRLKQSQSMGGKIFV